MSDDSYGTSGGVELTDQTIEELADEAKRGYDAAQLRTRSRRGRPPVGDSAASVFHVRLPPSLRGALEQAADAQQTTPSEIVRTALHAYVTSRSSQLGREKSEMMQFVTSQADLDQLKTSFWYEVGVLVSQGRLYLDHGHELAEDKAHLYPAADALFDALLVRLRSFDAFMRNTATHQSDAIAKHVVGNWQPREILTERQRKMINVRVAHLTYDRPLEHEWPIGKMIRRALEAIKDFLIASGPRYAEWNYRLNEVSDWLSQWDERDRIWTEKNSHAHTR